MPLASQVFDALLQRASSGLPSPRNLILDQTNVYASARVRKLRPFLRHRKVRGEGCSILRERGPRSHACPQPLTTHDSKPFLHRALVNAPGFL